MYKIDLALNNLQWLMCHKTKPNQTTSKHINILIILFINFVCYFKSVDDEII